MSNTPSASSLSSPAAADEVEVGRNGSLGDVVTVLRWSPQRWRRDGAPSPVKAAGVVVAGWVLLAWGRFGFQGLQGPRAVTRFVLIGVYGWLLLAALIGLAMALERRLRRSPVPLQGQGEQVLATIGLAHQPLLVFGFLLQIVQVLPIPGLMAVVAVFTFGLWLPGALLAATAAVFDRPMAAVAPVSAVAYLGWLLFAGRYLLQQLGHLL